MAVRGAEGNRVVGVALTAVHEAEEPNLGKALLELRLEQARHAVSGELGDEYLLATTSANRREYPGRN